MAPFVDWGETVHDFLFETKKVGFWKPVVTSDNGKRITWGNEYVILYRRIDYKVVEKTYFTQADFLLWMFNNPKSKLQDIT